MKKILFISSRPLYPITGGDQIRTVQQLEFLKEKYLVDVLYITPDDNDIFTPANKKNVNNIYRFKVNKYLSILQAALFIFNNLPIQVNYYYNRKTAKLINKIAHNYDAIFCNNIRTAQYAINLKNIIKYLDYVDAISMNYEKAKKNAHGLKKLIYSIDYNRCKKYEQHCLEKFDSCAVISDVDNNYISL